MANGDWRTKGDERFAKNGKRISNGFIVRIETETKQYQSTSGWFCGIKLLCLFGTFYLFLFFFFVFTHYGIVDSRTINILSYYHCSFIVFSFFVLCVFCHVDIASPVSSDTIIANATSTTRQLYNFKTISNCFYFIIQSFYSIECDIILLNDSFYFHVFHVLLFSLFSLFFLFSVVIVLPISLQWTQHTCRLSLSIVS